MKDSESTKSASGRSDPQTTAQPLARSAPGKGSRVASRYSTTSSNRSTVQAKGQAGSLEGADIEAIASSGTSGSGSALPHRAAIQAAFGQNHDISGVRAHTDSAASAATESLGANAFATGNQVAFAPAKADLHTSAHEAAHVIQQRNGVHLSGGVGSAGDPYEQHADAVADRVVQGKSAAGLLDSVPGQSGARGGPAVQRKAVQFDLRDGLSTVGTKARDAANRANTGARNGASGANTSVRNKATSGKELAREQHEARGNDEDMTGDDGDIPGFSDMAEDDNGPALHHDHGHLDDGSGNVDEDLREDPTWGDHLERLKWIAKLEAAELLRPDLVDGTSAYRHFLFGGGGERDIHYTRFLTNDSSGQAVLASAIEDTKNAAVARNDQDVGEEPTVGTETYQIRTDAVSVGNDGRYPYPATENWQKAIGAHSIWIEATVTVTTTRNRTPTMAPPRRAPTPTATPTTTPTPEGAGTSGEESSGAAAPTFSRHFEIEMTIHAEDRYNFNPGAADIATGAPDSANGRFEITGLGNEFLSTGTHDHSFEFDATMEPAGTADSVGAVDPGRSSRQGRPANRRNYPTSR